LKANAPVEFFAASMSLDISNTDKLAVFYQDAKRFGVPIRAPDVNTCGGDFEVEDGQVLYALGAVRNVGLEAMRHLVAVREEGGRFTDLFDFVERVDPRQVNKRAIENLARAGAFDSIHPNRAQIVAAADILIAHGQSVAADRASAQGGLFGDQSEAARPRLPRIEPWNAIQQLDEELAAVGFYLTGHPLGDMVEVLRRRRVTLMADAFAQAREGAEAFRMAGVVRRRQERTSARDGSKFAFVSLSDPSGEYEVMFQSDALRRCRDYLETGRSVVIRVRAKAGDGEVRLYAEDAEPIDRVLEQRAQAGLRVHVSPRSAEIDALKRRLEGAISARGGEITLVAGLDGREVELKLPGRFNLDAALRGALKTAPGVAYLEDV
jgi:DNA polymerase-3 subunit alpha